MERYPNYSRQCHIILGQIHVRELSKTKGQPSKKETEINLKKELIENVKNSLIYKNILEKFPDAELIDVKVNERKDTND